MNTLIPMQSVVIKFKAIIGKEYTERLEALEFNSVERALFIADVMANTLTITLEDAVDLICHKKGSYAANKDYVDSFIMESLNKH